MRMRDVYASLRELVPTHLAQRDGLRQEWTDRSDPIWRRGDRWVRVEAVTGTEVILTAGHGDVTEAQTHHRLPTGIDAIALEVAQQLDGAPA
ncbi:MAG: hypothetical protein JWO85_2362 [Candidatus Eremiobacteraeota bacterium]|nr:hypothetical protein [Candidatus Eremiobacteraeota bacterium]